MEKRNNGWLVSEEDLVLPLHCSLCESETESEIKVSNGNLHCNRATKTPLIQWFATVYLPGPGRTHWNLCVRMVKEFEFKWQNKKRCWSKKLFVKESC